MLYRAMCNTCIFRSLLPGEPDRHRACELSKETPFSWEVWKSYNEEREFNQGARVREYKLDQQPKKLKRCL